MEKTHKSFMKQALAQAKAAARAGEVPVGAVMVFRGKIIARARNEIVRRHDPTAHAEILAIQRAAAKIKNERLKSCILYVTLEPCAMCAGAALLARLAGVVFGAHDPKTGALGKCMDLSRQPKPNHVMLVTRGVMSKECGAILKRFFQKRR